MRTTKLTALIRESESEEAGYRFLPCADSKHGTRVILTPRRGRSTLAVVQSAGIEGVRFQKYGSLLQGIEAFQARLASDLADRWPVFALLVPGVNRDDSAQQFRCPNRSPFSS